MRSNMLQKHFHGRRLVIATMHGKEKVLQPQLERALGVKVVTTRELNTDEFGTFSGEVERELTPVETARRKCIEAARLTGETLVLASEGSFGAHPVYGFIPANEEVLVMKDFANDWEIKTKVISTNTNFAASEYRNVSDAMFFASQVLFPSHALILRKEKNDATDISKGIQESKLLRQKLGEYIDRYGIVYVETDMRAHLNPTRMNVIGEAGAKLISLIEQQCPICNGPGFDITQRIYGLPCGLCETPTRSVKAYIYHCQHCGYSEQKDSNEKRRVEDPTFCDECNP